MDKERLSEIYSRTLAAYQAGCRIAEDAVTPEDGEFLKKIGLRSGIVYDYAEDFARRNEPTLEDFLKVSAIRHAYFRDVQKEHWEPHHVPEKDLPLKTDELEGIPWLPRIIRKAQCFLTGTLCNEIMYGCGGDLAFIKKHNLNLVDFLTTVRDARSDIQPILRYVRGS